MVQAYPYPQYRLPRVHPNHYANRGVGVTSHLVPPFNPYAMPPKNPPGGPSSAAANAETNPTVAEKEAPVRNVYHPYTQCVTERVFVARPTAPRPERTCVSGGSDTDEISRSCAPGRRNGRSPKGVRPTSRRYKVSTDPIFKTSFDLIDWTQLLWRSFRRSALCRCTLHPSSRKAPSMVTLRMSGAELRRLKPEGGKESAR